MTALPSSRPGRAVLRLAGVLTLLISASSLLLGTIALVLVQQNASGGMPYVVAWAVAALVGLVFGGLMARGGLISLLASAVLDAGFGIVLLALDEAVLRGLVRVLPSSDVDMIADILVASGAVMLAVAALCLLAIPQALRYGHWLQADGESAADTANVTPLEPLHPGSTAKGWVPPPTTKMSVWAMPAASRAEARSRRRLYFALAGFAIGFGAGIGVLVSSATQRTAKAGGAASPALGVAAVAPPREGDAVVAGASSAGTGDVAPVGEGGDAEGLRTTTPAPSIQTLIQAQRAAIAAGDVDALVASVAPTAFGFGIDADEVAEGREAIATQVRRDLGEPPADGFNVEPRFSAIGEEKHHAWIALELAITAPGRADRRLAITQLAALVDGKWTVIAWHWAIPVPDTQAERLAILGTLPVPKPVANLTAAPADLAAAVRAAFASRVGFAAARSERADGFNFGSAPGERVVGGAGIKKLFGRLRAEIRLHDGARIVAGGAWDSSQQDAPYIAYVAANVDFTAKTRAATDLTQTFRVLAVFVKEADGWKIAQTQWSHGGPIR